MAKTLGGGVAGLKFELDNVRKDLRYVTPGRNGQRAHNRRRIGAPYPGDGLCNGIWQTVCPPAVMSAQAQPNWVVVVKAKD